MRGAWKCCRIMAMLFGLVIYTAAFIAEWLRAGIRFGVKGPDRGCLFARLRAGADLCALSSFHSDGVISSAENQPVSQPDQELQLAVAIGYPDLSDFCRHGADQTDRRRVDRHTMGGLSHDQPRHLGADEPYKTAACAGRKMSDIATTPERNDERPGFVRTRRHCAAAAAADRGACAIGPGLAEELFSVH